MPSPPFFFFLAAVIAVSALPLSATTETMLRYRAGGSGPAAGVSAAVPALTTLPALVHVERGADLGFVDFVYAPFRAGHRYAFAEGVDTDGLADGFTVVAHLRVHSQEGKQMIFTCEGEGVRLVMGLDEGVLYGELRGEGDAIERIMAPSPLAPGVWYRLVYLCQGPSGPGGPRHSLWVDETEVASANLAEGPTNSAGTPAQAFVGGDLLADVFAVSLESYALSDFFLESPLVRDGSAYFGALDFHDYLGDGTAVTLPLERRIFQTAFLADGSPRYAPLYERMQERWMLPFQNDGFIVQGLAADAAGRRVFIAMYHRTVNNTSYGFPSIIAEVSFPDGHLRHVYSLTYADGRPFTAHVGGIAYWDGLLFVPGPGRGSARDPDLFVFDLNDAPPPTFNPATLEGFAPVLLPVAKVFRDPLAILGAEGRFNSLSFMDIHLDAEDRVLLSIGNFQDTTAEPIHTFEVVFPQARDPVLVDPVTVQQGARRAQGVAFYFDVNLTAGRARRAFLSTSFGNNDSVIFRSTYLGARRDPVAHNEFLRLPAGLEDLALAGNRLFAQSESGGRYFQKRPSNPWTQTFPFLFALNIADQIDTNGNGIPDQWYARHGIPQGVSPETDYDGDGTSLALEFAWDTNPRASTDFPWSGSEVTVEAITLPTSSQRFYTLERLHEATEWMPVEEWTRHRGTGERMTFPLDPSIGGLYRILVEVD